MFKAAALLILSAASASAISVGFSSANIPVQTSHPLVWEENLDVPLLTVSFEPVSRLHLEGCYGFRTKTDKEGYYYSEDVDSHSNAFGFSSYYTVLTRGNAELRTGARFLRSITEVEEEGLTDYKCTMNRFGPSARIDFRIPGLEGIGLYSQWGIDFSRIETIYYYQGEEEQTCELDEWKSSGPQYILSGIYYSF